MSIPNEYTPGELALPRPPGVFRRWLTAHPRAVDWVIVATYLFGSAVMLLIMVVFLLNVDAFLAAEGDSLDDAELSHALVNAGHLTFGWGTVMLLSVALVATALLYRRRYPVVGVVLVSLLMYLDLGLLVVGNTVALAFLMFAVPVYRGVKAGWLAFAAAVLLAIGYSVLTNGMGGVVGPDGVAVAAPSESVTDLIIATGFNSAWLLAVLMVGLNVGNRKRYVEALIDRAHQLAREREQRAQLAAAAERNRIAREMHDIVAHSLSVVVTLSEAASVAVDTQPQAAKSAMQRASETGRNALVEMRRLLGVLGEAREQDEAAGAHTSSADELQFAPRAPQPGMAQKQQLIDGFRGAGLDITLSETGVPHGDASQQLAVFRIVQEGLTNALRYAGRGAHVQLSLTHTPADTRIEIVDSGKSQAVRLEPVTPDETLIPGSGKGLAGAAERARMFGGEFEAGPHGAGWRVTAIVPTAHHSPAANKSTSQEPRQNTQQAVQQSRGGTR